MGTKTITFLNLKEHVNEIHAPIYHVAEFGRREHSQITFLCPVCGNNACKFDSARSFTVEPLDSGDVDVQVKTGEIGEIKGKSGTPGLWIPMVCGDENHHYFTIQIETRDNNESVIMECHIQEATYDILFPELKEKWG